MRPARRPLRPDERGSPARVRAQHGVATDEFAQFADAPGSARVRARHGVATKHGAKFPTGWDPFTGRWIWGEPEPEIPWTAPKRERPKCGARCRSKGGAPCDAPVCRRPDGRGLARRCRIHGGLSTGAKSAKGRARLREAGRRGALERWRRWRLARQR
jgi:hypothetical protein